MPPSQLVNQTRAELEARDQLQLYDEIEVPLAPVLARMEAAGVTIDLGELDVVGSEVGTAASRLQKQIYDFAGEEFNIGSPQQLGNVLFGKLQIPGGKKTKTGWATGVEVLQGLAREYPICALVLDWREVTKLKNTYVDVIPRLVDARDGRLRTEFNQTATATGRLSSTNPNLQNIPVRGELGRRIRRAFVARSDEYALLAADYSQIELRLMAHLSGDQAMRDAFGRGDDIHDFTARQIFAVATGRFGRRQPAPHGQERQLRPVLRHVGFRARPAPGDRTRRGQGRLRRHISRAFLRCASISSARSKRAGATAT